MKQTLSVGFARIDITPTEPVPLCGYGNSHTRIHQGILDPIYATCIAFDDGKNTPLVLYTLDLLIAWPAFVTQVCAALEMDPSHVILSATHTHSGPECVPSMSPEAARYTQFVIDSLIRIGREALADCKPATIQIGRTQTKNLTFVRHYVQESGAYVGPNFGDFAESPIVRHASEADEEVQILKICRQDAKDILMINWQCHPYCSSSGATAYGDKYRPYVSADFITGCRDLIEAETGMHFAFFQGGGGNLGPQDKLHPENVPEAHIPFGQALGRYVLDALDTLEPVSAGKIGGKEMIFHGKVDHSEDHLLPLTQPILDCWAAYNNQPMCKKMGRPLGINSSWHALAIQRKSKLGEYLDMNIGAACVGDIGFAALPYEPFDSNCADIKRESPFQMTFVLGYANGYFNYMPSAFGFSYSCYETNSCKHIPGTGEAVADSIVDMLKQLHDQA